MRDRDETSQWLFRLQQTPAQICVEKPELRCPGKPQRAFQEEAGRGFGGCPTLCAGMAAELRLPLLTTAHLSNAEQLTSMLQVPGQVPHWPRPRVISPADLCTLADPATVPGPALSRSHWPVFWASPQSCLITRSLSDLFTEPGVNSTLLWTLFLSPDPPCLDPEGWSPGCWAPQAARGLLACSALTPQRWQPAIPCWGWRSCWNWEYRPDTHKIKGWHCVRALLSWKKSPRASC